MPRISEFYGIAIEMYFADHSPPHFHARYAGDEATIVIATGDVLAGSLLGEPSGWCENGWTLIGAKLEANWDRARRHEQPAPIAPLI